jgi:hypothetical protein
MYSYFVVFNYTDHSANKGTYTGVYEVDNPLVSMDYITDLEVEIQSSDRSFCNVVIVNFILLQSL